MSATARSPGSTGTAVNRTGTVVHRTGTLRTGAVRTGTHRTGVVRGGAGRTTAARPSAHRPAGSRTAPSPRVPVRPELRVVPPATPARARRTGTRSRRAPFVLLVLALLVGTALSLLVLNTAIAVDSLRATTLRQQNAHREEAVQRLEQEVVEGSTPEKLADAAAAAGLVPAGTAGYLVVEPDGTSSFRGSPTPAAPPRATGQDATGSDATGQDGPGQDAAGQDATPQDQTAQEQTGGN